MVVEERQVEIIALHSCEDLGDDAYDVLGWIANAIALGIDRSWARQELVSRREALLLQLASQIRNSLELCTVLNAAVEGIRSLLKVDRCLFAWYRPGDCVGVEGNAIDDGAEGIMLELVSEAYGDNLMPLPRTMDSAGIRDFVAQLTADDSHTLLRASDVTMLDEPDRKSTRLNFSH